MSTLPRLAARDIRAWAGERSHDLGLQYYRDGAITDTRRQGRTLKAICAGSSGGPYRVEATLGEEEVTDADCSCPVGGGGRCKHVGALLHAWVRKPGDFREVEDVDTSLERRGKAELIALVKLMLRRRPDLESLLETPLPGGDRSRPASADEYRRQAVCAFQETDDDWEYGRQYSNLGDELEAIRVLGDEFLQQEDYACAVAVFEGVARAVLENYQSEYDQEGEAILVLRQCTQGLALCLAALKDDPVRREAILRTLLDTIVADTEQGGIGMDEGALGAILEHATAEERRTVAGWARAALPGGNDWSSNWRRQSLGAVLLELEADVLDDESYLKLARETGLEHRLVERLLQLGREDEAVKVVEHAEGGSLLDLANLLVKHRRGDVAERLVRARLGKQDEHWLLPWLKDRAQKRHDDAAVFELAETIFRRQPSQEGYLELKKLAGKERWPRLRSDLLEHLKENHPHLLVKIHLKEGEVGEALKEIKGEKRTPYGWSWSWGLRLEVAKAAERSHPREAIEIYRQEAEAEIGHRSREHYRAACKHLARVKKLYSQEGDDAGWGRYVAKLREQFPTLRALREEMTRAKL